MSFRNQSPEIATVEWTNDGEYNAMQIAIGMPLIFRVFFDVAL